MIKWLVVLAALLMPAQVMASTVTLTVVGDPTTGPWAVQGVLSPSVPTFARVFQNGVQIATENAAPYCSFSDDNVTCTKKLLPNGTYAMEFRFFASGTTTELARGTLTVTAGPATSAPGKVAGLTVVTDTSVQLLWQANTEPDVAGYRLYAGFSSKVYGGPVGQSTAPTGTVSGLQAGKTYYFAVTAVDTSHNESGFSNEVVYTVP